MSVAKLALTVAIFASSDYALAQNVSAPAPAGDHLTAGGTGSMSYILGPEDVLQVKVINAEDIGTTPYPIDLAGKIKVPMIGFVQAGGLTVGQVQEQITERLKAYIRRPDVSVTITDFRSQPVSILGAVGSPGTYQIRGRKTLFEVISEAGGLKPDAGNTINIARHKSFGDVPIPGSADDSTGQFSIAQLNIRAVMRAQDPAANTVVKPFDVLTVPKADLIYVVGDVKKPGGFPLVERSSMSLLEAVSIAEGLDRTAGAKNAKILRAANGEGERVEVPIDLTQVLNGQKADMFLQPNDILYVPVSGRKVASNRAVEALIQIGTGVAIFAK